MTTATTETINAVSALSNLPLQIQLITADSYEVLIPTQNNFYELPALSVGSILSADTFADNEKTYIRVLKNNSPLDNVNIRYLFLYAHTLLGNVELQLVKHTQNIDTSTTDKWFGTFENPFTLTFQTDGTTFLANGLLVTKTQGATNYTITANYQNIKLPMITTIFSDTGTGLLDGFVKMDLKYENTNFAVTINKTNGQSNAIVNGKSYSIDIGAPNTSSSNQTLYTENTLNLYETTTFLQTTFNTFSINNLTIINIARVGDTAIFILRTTDGITYAVKTTLSQGVFTPNAAVSLGTYIAVAPIIINNHIVMVNNSNITIYDSTLSTVATIPNQSAIQALANYDGNLMILKNSTFDLYDISTPSSPSKIDSYSFPETYYPTEGKVSNKKLILNSDNSSTRKIVVLNLTDLNNITEIKSLSYSNNSLYYSNSNFPRITDVFGLRNVDINENTFIIRFNDSLLVYPIDNPTSYDGYLANPGATEFANENHIVLGDLTTSIKIFERQSNGTRYTFKKSIQPTGIDTVLGVNGDTLVVSKTNTDNETIISLIDLN